MKKVSDFLRGEAAGWQKWEIIWMIFCLAATGLLSYLLNDTLPGIIAAQTALLYTLLAGKGKISCYLFGIVNTVLYGWLSWQNRLYGEVMLNWGWYLPMMFTGLFCWRRHLDDSCIIRKRRLSSRARLHMLLLTAAGIVVYAFILRRLNDQSPWLDSFTTVVSITAMIMTVRRCLEQWLLWTAVNAVSTVMWLRIYWSSGTSAALVIMWSISLANGIIFFLQWYRAVEKSEQR